MARGLILSIQTNSMSVLTDVMGKSKIYNIEIVSSYLSVNSFKGQQGAIFKVWFVKY